MKKLIFFLFTCLITLHAKSFDVQKVHTLLLNDTITNADRAEAAQEIDRMVTGSNKVVTLGKLAIRTAVFGFACRFIYNAVLLNEDADYSGLLYRFFKGLRVAQLAGSGTDRVPHLPLIAASGAILILSGQYAWESIKELRDSTEYK
jgi:hypothetical protein